MIDIKFLRENPEAVKENIRKKFQDHKLPLVDEVIELDAEARKTQQEADNLRAERNKLSKQIGALMGQKKFEEAEEAKKLVAEQAAELAALQGRLASLTEHLDRMYTDRLSGLLPEEDFQRLFARAKDQRARLEEQLRARYRFFRTKYAKRLNHPRRSILPAFPAPVFQCGIHPAALMVSAGAKKSRRAGGAGSAFRR